MTERLTTQQILERKRGHQEVVLDGGGSVLVRGLAHAEAHQMREQETVAEKDAFMIATGLVDPVMTLEQVLEWFAIEGESGNLQLIAVKISELSGMLPGQGKDATKSVPRGRGRGRA
jgi:hypothetical protein